MEKDEFLLKIWDSTKDPSSNQARSNPEISIDKDGLNISNTTYRTVKVGKGARSIII
jgi:hypothetical protein